MLRRQARLLVLGVLLGAGAAFLMSHLTPPVYRASTTLLINATDNTLADESGWRIKARGQVVFKGGSANLNSNWVRLSDQRAPTYAEMLLLPSTVAATLQELGLSFPVDSLPAQLNVNLTSDTQLLDLQVTSPDAQLAVDLARTLPAVFNHIYATLLTAQYAETQANLAQEIAAVQDQVAQAQVLINALETPRDLAQAADLERLQSDQAQLRQSLAELTKTSADLRLTVAQANNSLIVVEPALAPTAPIYPRPIEDTVLGGLIGLLGAIGLASLIEAVDDRVRSSDQIERVLHLPVIGRIAQWPTSDPALLAWHTPRAPMVEAFRALRTNLQFAGVDHPLRTLLITSDSPSQGKSTIAANLAVVMAQAGLRVALVDADLRHPNLHRMFDRANREGLTEVLRRDPTEWPTCAMLSGVPNLSLVVSGALPPNPAELLGSQRMRQWLEFLRQTHDVVIIDAPPILSATDATVLAHQVDGVVLVAAYGVTRLRTAAVSKQQLDQPGVRCVGVVLNRLPPCTWAYQRDYQPHGATTQADSPA